MIITDFRWRNWEPQIVIESDASEAVMPIMNQYLRFTTGKRFCTGYTKKGRSFECPESRQIDSGRQCQLCRSLDDSMPCVQCMGFCTNPGQRKRCVAESYSIYLASFGSLVKVGISHEFRLKQRLVEQGADFGAKIATMKDGRMIRVHEQRIKRFLGITDRVMGRQKHLHFFSDPSECIRSLNASIARLSGSPLGGIMGEIEIFDMRGYYNLADVKPSMQDVEEGTEVEGRVICVKGNMMVVENGTCKCIDGHALIGREVFMNGSGS